MFSVMKCTSDSVRVFQTDIATLDEARTIASRMQRLAPNKEITYFVRERHRRAAKKLSTRTNSNSPASHSPANNSGISQQRRHKSGKYRVIRVQGTWKQYVEGAFQSVDEAVKYALELQRQTSDSTIIYQVIHQVEYPPSTTSNLPDSNQLHKPGSQRQPRQEESTNKSKLARKRRANNRETKSRSRTRDAYLPYYYYSGELLGLGIPAQAGHGRHSRRWFNDF